MSIICKRGSIVWSSRLVLSLLLHRRLCLLVMLWLFMIRRVWRMRMMPLLVLMARARLPPTMRTTCKRMMMMTMMTVVTMMVIKMTMMTMRMSSWMFTRPTPFGTC